EKTRSIFHAPSRKFKILVIPDILAHCKSYEHGFPKKCDGHKLGTKLHAKSSFDRFFVYHLGNSKYWPFPTISPWEVVRAWFRKKTRRSYTLRESRGESSFDPFFMHHPKNSKYWPFPTY
ncbi:hypothetical protein BHE74_00057842, partial [Ensete ventricosum]